MYCDGSGKSDNPDCRFLSLAGIMASDDQWVPIEDEWQKVLDDNGAPFSHMSKLLLGYPPFVGWSEKKKQTFVGSLLNVLAKGDRNNFIGCTLTIDLTAYRELAAGAVKPVEAVCVDYVASHAFRHPRFRDGKAEIIFDLNESFIKHLERIWKINKNNASSWAGYVASVAPADGKVIKPIQIADFLAWSANREHASEAEDFWKHACPLGTFIMLNNYREFYGKADLMKHPGFFEWNPPPP